MLIELPNYNWFVNGQGESRVTNAYTGSCGTIPDTGCLSTTTFNYKVYAVLSSDDGKERIIAECYLILPWSSGGKKDKFARAEFENNVDGLKQAQRWLSEKVVEYHHI